MTEARKALVDTRVSGPAGGGGAGADVEGVASATVGLVEGEVPAPKNAAKVSAGAEGPSS